MFVLVPLTQHGCLSLATSVTDIVLYFLHYTHKEAQIKGFGGATLQISRNFWTRKKARYRKVFGLSA